MMLPLFLLAAALVPLLSPGDPLPPLRGDFLTGRPATLPDAASGRIALIAVGFSYESRFAVEAWIGRFRKDFGGKPDVTFFEVPMVGGMARMGKWFIDSGMRQGTPKQDQENVITVYGGTESWKQRLGFASPGAAHLILLDRRGTVRWLHPGKFDETAYTDLSAHLNALLAAKPE